MLEVYRKLRPGEPPTVDSAISLLNALFFDPRRYDLSMVGRYKFNKKLALWNRLSGQTLAMPIADPATGELLAEAGEVLSREKAKELESKGIDAEVLDLRTLVPLDFDAIKESVTKTGRVVIVHESTERTGYGAEIAAQIADKLFDELDAPIVRVCGANIPVPNATLPEIESAPTVEKIVKAAVRVCQGGKWNG